MQRGANLKKQYDKLPEVPPKEVKPESRINVSNCEQVIKVPAKKT